MLCNDPNWAGYGPLPGLLSARRILQGYPEEDTGPGDRGSWGSQPGFRNEQKAPVARGLRVVPG